MEQVQKQHKTQEKVEPEVTEIKKKDSTALKKELDDLLDEIDKVLEEDAEAFIKSFVNHGGE